VDFSRRQIFNEKNAQGITFGLLSISSVHDPGIAILALSLDPCLPKKELVSIATTTAKSLVLGVQEKVTCTSQMF
jgi:hypothetical protein